MNEDDFGESPAQNPDQNFGVGHKVFAPPTDGQGISAPRESAKTTPQFHANTYQTLERQTSTAAAAPQSNTATTSSSNIATANSAIIQSSAVPATDIRPIYAQQEPPIANRPTEILHPGGKVAAIILGVITLIVFGPTALATIFMLLNPIAVTSSLIFLGTSNVFTIIITVSTLIIAIVFAVSAIGVIRLQEHSRKSWLLVSKIMAGGIALLLIWRIISLIFSSVSEISTTTISPSSVVFSIIISLVSLATANALNIAGWIILTRKSVRAWFA